TRSKRDWSSDVCSSDLQGEFHVLKNESLILNDFLEIVYKKTKEGLVEVFAQLKGQNVIEKDLTTVRMVKNFKVLLFKENKSYHNQPSMELGPEFQAKIDLAMTEKRHNDLFDTYLNLVGVGRRNRDSDEIVGAVNITEKALKEDILRAKINEEQARKRYLDYMSDLQYIRKFTLM